MLYIIKRNAVKKISTRLANALQLPHYLEGIFDMF
jgi:hypothetical protein